MSHKKKASYLKLVRMNEPREQGISEQGIGEPESVDNGNFRSELQYDGYKDIEDYDNDVFSANPEAEENPDHELTIVEREDPTVQLGSQASEEDLLDPQENRRKPA